MMLILSSFLFSCICYMKVSCEVTCIGELIGSREVAHCPQVVNMVAPTLLKTCGLFDGATPSSFSRLRHLTLMIDPTRCFFDKPSQLNTSMIEIGKHGQLESLYIGFTIGFCCSLCGSSTCGRRRADAEDSLNLCLSSMQHLESVHLDSFWPALLELPPRASLHATFKSAPGQKHPGLWAGRPADVQSLQLPLRSAHFLLGAGLDAEHAITATELWPLKVKRSIELIRVMAGTLHLDLLEFPGLMQAERVLITASECHLRFPGSQTALEHLEVSFSERLKLVISNVDSFAAKVENLILTREVSMDSCPVSVLLLRDAALAAGKELSVSSRRSKCQHGGRKRREWENASWGAWCAEDMGPGKWAHAVRCCCNACLACLHRNGVAAFPEADAQEDAMLGA